MKPSGRHEERVQGQGAVQQDVEHYKSVAEQSTVACSRTGVQDSVAVLPVMRQSLWHVLCMMTLLHKHDVGAP
jgi:hypothetical protein